MSRSQRPPADPEPAEAEPAVDPALTKAAPGEPVAEPELAVAAPVRAELFGPSRRATTVGVLLLISMVAFEAMGVGTAMPALVASLGALSLYAWPFVAFMAAGVFGTVLGGRWCDVAGPRGPLVLAPGLFAAGLLTAGGAHGMPQLLVGRTLQGLGAGSVTVAIYVLVGLVYPERVRPAMFGLMSSAWVLPSLVGPPIAGLVTERFSWRWVFFGLVPVAVLALALVVPAMRRLGRPDPDRAGAVKRPGVVLAALGAAVGVSALSWAGERPDATAALVLAAALLVLVPAVRRLLPPGVFRVRRGIPTVIACRGLCAALFFTANSYLPLMLTSTHHWSLAAAGTPLVVGSLGWSSASWWQGRHPDLARPRLLRIGFCLLAFGAAALLLVAPRWGTPWLAPPVWAAAGVGMGLCFPSVGFLLLRQSAPGKVGFHTSAAQMSDQLGTATMIGVGGALLALLTAPATALPVLFAALTALGVVGALIAPRAAAEAPPG
jgi:MFS family permease